MVSIKQFRNILRAEFLKALLEDVQSTVREKFHETRARNISMVVLEQFYPPPLVKSKKNKYPWQGKPLSFIPNSEQQAVWHLTKVQFL